MENIILNETFRSNSRITMGKYLQLMHMVYFIFYIAEEIEKNLNKIWDIPCALIGSVIIKIPIFPKSIDSMQYQSKFK